MVWAKDEDSNGHYEFVTSYTYDARGNVLTQTEDHNADGTMEKSWTYTYNLRNELLTTRFDTTGDGNIDASVDYSYNYGVCFSLGGPFDYEKPYLETFGL